MSATTAPLFDGATYDWSKYLLYRPPYRPAFYDILLAYHAAGANTWALAADLGTGIGLVALELAQHFGRVLASDASAAHVAKAEAYAASCFPRLAPKVQWRVRPAEERIDAVDGEVDFVAIAEAIHWMDFETVVKGCAAVLRKGGTLAVWLYATSPYFVRGRQKEEAQEALNGVYDAWYRGYLGMVKTTRPARIARSKLDVVGFDEEVWEDGVRRYYWGTGHELRGDVTEWDGEAKLASRKKDKDLSVICDDDMLFSKEFDTGLDCFEWFHRYIFYLYPGLNVDEEAAEHYARLRELLGEAQGDFCISWPASLILARKK